MNGQTTQHFDSRVAAERALAVVGFIALVALGIGLAIYSARYVPTTVNRLGAAAVALTSVFRPSDASLSVVPSASTTISFGDGTAITSNSTSTTATSIPPTPTPGTKTSSAYPIGTTTAVENGAPILSGLPDLSTTILTTGYLTGTSTDTFVATSTVPQGGRAAVKFTIQNIGTNVAATGWHFSASIPTQSAYVFYSPAQQGLNPGDSIEYTLGFDQASPGVNHSISIVANSDHAISESNTGNDSATASITVLSS